MSAATIANNGPANVVQPASVAGAPTTVDPTTNFNHIANPRSRMGHPRSATRERGDSSDEEPDMTRFAKLRYGKNEEMIFNITCQVQNIINFFRRKCRDLFTGNETLDLVDKDGNLKNLRLVSNQSKLASEFLNPRETYILVDVRPMEVANYYQCEPFLTDSELLTTSLMNKLTPKVPKNLLRKQQNANKASNKKAD